MTKQEWVANGEKWVEGKRVFDELGISNDQTHTLEISEYFYSLHLQELKEIIKWLDGEKITEEWAITDERQTERIYTNRTLDDVKRFLLAITDKK